MNLRRVISISMMLWIVAATGLCAQDARIVVRADRIGPMVSPHMTGVCIEDVNHEIYGGIYSQMVFGESFQEPPRTTVEGFTGYGGTWAVDVDELHAAAGDGPKLLVDGASIGTGEVAVQMFFPDDKPGLAGLIVKVNNAGVGADRFNGYEISLDPSRQVLGFGRHRQNWEHIRDVPCKVPVGQWIDLDVRMTETQIEVRVGGKLVLDYEDRDHPLPEGAFGLRTWQRDARFRALKAATGAERKDFPFRTADSDGLGGVSGMWRPTRRGSATGSFSLETAQPFVGRQSQRIQFDGGDGAIGVGNRGLNGWGMNFAAGKPYEGYIWARADRPAQVFVSAESGGGERLAEAALHVEGAAWKRYDFVLTPTANDEAGRLAITLKSPGTVLLGHAFLQPGKWGRFKGLPVRKDVAEGLIDAGVTVMRLGGLMANSPGYRWKHMGGARDRRSPYEGFWYPHSSNGWGIFEFLQFCEAAGFLPIVDLNMEETPQDLADFVEYANGAVDSTWGKRRAADGHPDPYRLKYIELGNEEAVDESYWQKFKPLAEAAWAKDPEIVLIVGDFEYKQNITDPENFEGAPRIKSLSAHKKILELARDHKRPVWFDVHIWNHNPKDARGRIEALRTIDSGLAKLCPGAEYFLCVLEENATNHAVRRAVAHAETVSGLMRMGDRVRIVCAASALQPDGQNDNGWDQGLVFLDPSRVWLQPPAYVTQMISQTEPRQLVQVDVSGVEGEVDVVGLLSDDRKHLTLHVTNLGDRARVCEIDLEGFRPTNSDAEVTELTGPLDATNTAREPVAVSPKRLSWRYAAVDGLGTYTFPPYSFTTLLFESQ